MINEMNDFLILFIWIPSHKNINGNVRVDELAKQGTLILNIADVKESLVERKANIRRDCMEMWQSEWENNRSFYKDIKNQIEVWPSAFQKNRREEIILCRLRLNVCKFAFQHYFERTERLTCNQCRVPITLQHIIVECPLFARYRHTLGNVDGLELTSILKNDYNHSRIFQYLRDIDYFNQI